MLLPQYNEQGEEIQVEDPRRELVQRLLEYQKFQEAGQKLIERPLVGRDIWLRARREDVHVDDDSVEVDESGLFGLISSYRKMIRFMEKRIHTVREKAQSISSRILEMADSLVVGTRLRMVELITAHEAAGARRQLLITFLAMLELGKMGYVRLFQSDNFGDIFVDPQKPIEREVVVRVEEYDSQNASALAEALMAAPTEVVSEEKNTEQIVFAELDKDSAVAEAMADDAATAASDEEIAAAELELEA